jgi:hypothetical protein
MLYLDQKFNRASVIAATTVATAALLVATVPGINAVGVLLAVGLVNIGVYYAMPDKYSKTYAEKHLKRYH